jgi:hypothetical protein
MIATDPLSLVFLFCVLFSGGFFVVTTLLGVGHATHLGGHVHLGGHLDAHAGGHVAGHLGNHGVASHAAPTHGSSGAEHAGSSPGGEAAWQSLGVTLLNGLNIYSILLSLFVLGLLGYLLHNFTNVGDTVTILLPLALGAGAGIGLGNAISGAFRTSEASLLGAESSRLEGRLGTVSMAIHEGGTGEIIFTTKAGTRQSVGARSGDGQTIPLGEEVVILGYHDGIASVQTWDKFMLDVRAGQPIAGLLPPLS